MRITRTTYKLRRKRLTIACKRALTLSTRLGRETGGWSIVHRRVQPLPEAPHTLCVTLLAAFVLPVLLSALLASAARGAPLLARAAEALALLAAPSVFAVLGVLRRRGLAQGPVLPHAEGAGRAVLLGLAAGAAAFACNAVLNGLSLRVFGWLLGAERVAAIAAAEQARTLALLTGSPWWLAYVGAVVVLWSPLCEEIFFRGYVYAALRHHLAPGAAVVASAALFALFHLYVVQSPAVFAAGLLFAWAYERTGSILVPAVAHATVNAAVAGILLWLN